MTEVRDPLADAPELCRLGVAALTARYADGSLSPVEVAEATLARAEVVQERHNAFTEIDHEGALVQAREAEARWRRHMPASAIDGVPTTLKDIVWVAGKAIHYGSNSPPVMAAHDAPAVARLRAAGAVFIGLTTTPEFGWKALTDSPFSGVTTNPWNAALTPGGSSGGAAVAAATGAGVLHLGTDGGGSIRIPSSFTGIFGIKPSYGRVPAYPPSPFGTVSHIGPMTRTCRGCGGHAGSDERLRPAGLDPAAGPAARPRAGGVRLRGCQARLLVRAAQGHDRSGRARCRGCRGREAAGSGCGDRVAQAALSRGAVRHLLGPLAHRCGGAGRHAGRG